MRFFKQGKFLLLACIASISVFTVGDVCAEENDGRVAPGDRNLSAEEKMSIAQEQKGDVERLLKQLTSDELVDLSITERLKKAVEEVDLKLAESDCGCGDGNCSGCHQGQCCGCGSYYGPGTFQNPAMVTMDSVELLDGSIWHVRECCRGCIQSWYPADAIAIAPNDTWFSSYPFKLVNMDANHAVEAHMKWGPFLDGPYTRWILAIDYYNQEIWLNDGTHWTITGMDSSVFRKFLPNDTILVGINEDWQAYRMPNVLINVNLCSPSNAPYSFVRAVSSF